MNERTRSWDHAVTLMDARTRRAHDGYIVGVFAYGWSGRTLCEDPSCPWNDLTDWQGLTKHVHGDSQPHWTHCREVRNGKRGTACHERCEFVVEYSYGAGRGGSFRSRGGLAGRASRHTRDVCRKHAETFAKKYRVAMPGAVLTDGKEVR